MRRGDANYPATLTSLARFGGSPLRNWTCIKSAYPVESSWFTFSRMPEAHSAFGLLFSCQYSFR